MKMRLYEYPLFLFIVGLCSCISTNPENGDTGPAAKYINLSLPSAGESIPLVLPYSDSEIVVVRLVTLSGHRDIQVLAGDGYKWKILGENGNGITGRDSTFLVDARTDSAGRPWVLAHYTMPDTGFLYCFTNERWSVVGPQNGYEFKEWFGCYGMAFTEDGNPVLLLKDVISNGPKLDRSIRMLVLDGEQWRSVDEWQQPPGGMYVNAKTCAHENEEWVVCASGTESESRLYAWCLRGPFSKKYSNPVELCKVPYQPSHFNVRLARPSEIILLTGPLNGQLNLDSFVFEDEGIRRVERKKIDGVPSFAEGSAVYSIAPKGAIYGLQYDSSFLGNDVVDIFRLVDDSWLRLRRHECEMPGHIDEIAFAFTNNEEPIVTWSKSIRCGELHLFRRHRGQAPSAAGSDRETRK